MKLVSRALTIGSIVLVAGLMVTAGLAATTALPKYPDGTLVKIKGLSTVYVLWGSYRNPVRSKVDFDALGYRSYAVRTVTSADLKGYKLGATLAHVATTEGTLITAAGDSTVYLVEDGYRRPVAGPSVLTARGRSLREVKRLHPVQLQQLPLGSRVTVNERRDGQLVRTTANPTVYLLDHGEKKPIVSAMAFETRGFHWDAVKVVRPSELEPYPTGEAITESAAPTLGQVSSCDDLARLLVQGNRRRQPIQDFMEIPVNVGAPAASQPGRQTSDTASEGNVVSWGTQEYSTTNVQVAGVDEADIVKTDGTYVYSLSVREVSISTASPAADAKRIGVITVATSGFVPRELFVAGDRLAVIGDVGETRALDLDWLEAIVSQSGQRAVSRATRVAIYNISDRSRPTLVRTIDLDGRYQTSRLIGQELTLVLRGQPNVRPLPADVSSALPTIRDSRGAGTGATQPLVRCEDVRYTYPVVSDSFLTVANLNLTQDQRPLARLVILDSGDNVYVSRSHLYLTQSQFNSGLGNRLASRSQTNVIRIALQPGVLTLDGSAMVPGTLLNQFSLDEHNGYLRLATTAQGGRWGSRSAANVYVLDSDLRQVGAVENLAPGEQITAARFLGTKGYLVTFRRIDPFFTLDLANPASPKLVGELKISGFSTYLHPYDDTHLIGLGENTSDVELGTEAGVKLALFDLTDFANPRLQHETIVGSGDVLSLAGQDHRAFLFDRAKQLLVIPVIATEREFIDDDTGPTTRNREVVRLDAYVYRLSPQDGFQLKARVSHLPNEVLVEDNFGGTTDALLQLMENIILRSLYIGNNLYTFSPGRLVITDLTSYTKVGEIRLEDLAQVFAQQVDESRRKARDAQRLSDIRQTQTALELYFNDQELYPTVSSVTVLGASGARCLSDESGVSATCTGTVYFSSLPADPQSPTRQYLLQPNAAAPRTYCITFTLEGATGGYPAGQLYATHQGISTTGCVLTSGAGKPGY